MRVLVSACLMGENCKYSGGNNRCPALVDFLMDKEVVAVCPEVLGGLPTPRPCAERCGDRVVDVAGHDVTDAFRRGVARAMRQIAGQHFDLAVLQPRSPSCGVHTVYDGKFRGNTIPGQGLFAEALCEAGYTVFDCEDFLKQYTDLNGF